MKGQALLPMSTVGGRLLVFAAMTGAASCGGSNITMAARPMTPAAVPQHENENTAAAAEPLVSFVFRPSVGSSFQETTTSVKRKETGDRPVEENRRFVTQLTRVELVDETYVFHSRLLEAQSDPPEQSLPAMLDAVLRDRDIDLKVTQQGELTSIEGVDTVVEALLGAFPLEVSQMLSSIVNEENMVARIRAEWDGRYGPFVNTTVRIGEVIETTVPYRLPSGHELQCQNRIRFAGFEPCGDARCVRIETISHTDKEGLNALVNHTMDQVLAMLEPTPVSLVKPGSAEASIRGAVVLVIDSATMKIHRELRILEMSGVFEGGDGEARPTVQWERRETEYQYLGELQGSRSSVFTSSGKGQSSSKRIHSMP